MQPFCNLEHFYFSSDCIGYTKSQAGTGLKRTIPLLFLCALFFFLLFFPTQTLDASKTGLLLWFDGLLPTLLPFLIVSQLILKTSLSDNIQKCIGPAFRRLYHCSENGSFCLLCGFLCGYPVGARLIALQIKENKLSLEEGQYLLSFCNNVSPMFCISYGILQTIKTTQILPYLCCIYGSSLLFGFLSRPKTRSSSSFTHTKKQTPPAENIFQLVDVCIIDSFLILIKLCGYLILFSIFYQGMLLLLPKANHTLTTILALCLEITSGLSKLQNLEHFFLRSLFGVGALTFGGLCCIFQTNSVISETKLSLGKYVLHKILITLLSLCLFFLWHFFVRNWFSIDCWSQFLTIFSNHFIISV